MKASDVNEEEIITAILNSPINPLTNKPSWATHWQGFPNSIPDQGFLQKVLLAKLRAMKKRGLIEGCGCGCRGDWVVLEK